VVEQDERRRRKSAAGEGPAVAVTVLPLVRIWVCREAALPYFGGGGRRLWGLQGLKRRWREKEGRNVGWKRKQRRRLIFGPEFPLLQAMKCTPIYRRWNRDSLSLMVPNPGHWFGW
jgi:hypothetical protein